MAAVCKPPDPRGFAFSLASCLLVLCTIKSVDPTDLFTYVPVVSGSIALALYGIHVSSHHLLWPANITTGLVTLISVYHLVLSVPYLTIPSVMYDWGKCKGFVMKLNDTDSEFTNITATELGKTISCYFGMLFSYLHFVPLLCTLFFGMTFLLFKNSQQFIKRQKLVYPGEQKEGASLTAPLNMPLIGFSAFIILSIAHFARCIAFYFYQDSFTTTELVEMGANAAFALFSLSLYCYADVKKAFAAAILLYSALKAFVDFVQASFIVANTRFSFSPVLDCSSQLNSLNVTTDLSFSLYNGWNIRVGTNNTDLSNVSEAEFSCLGDLHDFEDYAYCFPLLATSNLLVCTFSFWLEILFSEESFLQTTKKIIHRGF